MNEVRLCDEDRNLLEFVAGELQKFNKRADATDVVTCRQAARIIGVDPSTISRYIRQGKLHKVIRAGVVGILRSELRDIKPM